MFLTEIDVDEQKKMFLSLVRHRRKNIHFFSDSRHQTIQSIFPIVVMTDLIKQCIRYFFDSISDIPIDCIILRIGIAND